MDQPKITTKIIPIPKDARRFKVAPEPVKGLSSTPAPAKPKSHLTDEEWKAFENDPETKARWAYRLANILTEYPKEELIEIGYLDESGTVICPELSGAIPERGCFRESGWLESWEKQKAHLIALKSKREVAVEPLMRIPTTPVEDQLFTVAFSKIVNQHKQRLRDIGYTDENDRVIRPEMVRLPDEEPR